MRHGLAVIAHLRTKMFHRIAARFTISLIFGSFRVSSSAERPRLTVSPVDNPWIKFRSITRRYVNRPISLFGLKLLRIIEIGRLNISLTAPMFWRDLNHCR